MDRKPISFIASIAPLQSAITISGDGGGLRVKFDIPETELLGALHMLAVRQTAFKVTIEPIANDDDKDSQNRKASAY